MLKEVPQEQRPSADNVELSAVLQGVAVRWRIVVATAASLLAITFLWLLFAQAEYVASVVLVRSVQDSDSSLGGSATSALNALSKLSPLKLNQDSDQGNSPYGQFRRSLNTGALAVRLAQRYGLMQIIYADRWDRAHARWLPPSGLRALLSMTLNFVTGQPAWVDPRPEIDLAAFIKGRLTISVDESGDYLTLRFRHVSRSFALEMLTRIFKEADGLVKDRERINAEQDLAYLRSRFEQTQNIGYREIFIDQIAALERRLMLLQGDRSYAVQVFDGPNAPLQPTEPRPLLYCLLAVGVGLVLGLLFAIMNIAKTGDRYVPHWPGASVAAYLIKKANDVRHVRHAGSPRGIRRRD